MYRHLITICPIAPLNDRGILIEVSLARDKSYRSVRIDLRINGKVISQFDLHENERNIFSIILTLVTKFTSTTISPN